MDRLRSLTRRFRTTDDEAGQGLAEYALLLTLISVAVMVALTTLQGAISGVFDAVAEALAIA